MATSQKRSCHLQKSHNRPFLIVYSKVSFSFFLFLFSFFIHWNVCFVAGKKGLLKNFPQISPLSSVQRTKKKKSRETALNKGFSFNMGNMFATDSEGREPMNLPPFVSYSCRLQIIGMDGFSFLLILATPSVSVSLSLCLSVSLSLYATFTLIFVYHLQYRGWKKSFLNSFKSEERGDHLTPFGITHCKRHIRGGFSFLLYPLLFSSFLLPLPPSLNLLHFPLLQEKKNY